MDLGGRTARDLTPEERRVFKAFQRRRERIVQKCRQIELDIEYWNATHPGEEPIAMVFDFTNDMVEVEG